MRKVLIVDDEAIVRVTLRSMIRWEDYGMQVVADFQNGYAALEYIRENSVDLLITDVKMPEMSGIELLRRLNEEGNAPITLMLSGYNEFDLVREAFRLGICDYLLKADLNEKNLGKFLTSLNQKYWDGERNAGESFQDKKQSAEWPQEGTYGVCILEIEDFQKQAVRFGKDLKEMMEKPMLELANQIPRVNKRGRIMAVQPGHYVLFYKISDIRTYDRDILSVIRQIKAVWQDFMNLKTSVAVSDAADASQLRAVTEKLQDLLLFAPLNGKGSIVTMQEHGKYLAGIGEAGENYRQLLARLYQMDENGLQKEKQKLFQRMDSMSREKAIEECLKLIALLAMKFREYEEDFFAVFPEEINYFEKLSRIDGIRELELWIGNYLYWILEYFRNRLSGQQEDVMQRAQRFMEDNYFNPELTLGSVAEYVGFSEKYFTTRFTKEVGITFRDYLTQIRLERAKILLDTTDFKMYEISERIGYNNVEHFNRMFKKKFGISPGDYKKEKKIKNQNLTKHQ